MSNLFVSLGHIGRRHSVLVHLYYHSWRAQTEREFTTEPKSFLFCFCLSLGSFSTKAHTTEIIPQKNEHASVILNIFRPHWYLLWVGQPCSMSFIHSFIHSLYMHSVIYTPSNTYYIYDLYTMFRVRYFYSNLPVALFIEHAYQLLIQVSRMFPF